MRHKDTAALREFLKGCRAIAVYDQEALDELPGLSSAPTDSKEAEFAVCACCIGRPA